MASLLKLGRGAARRVLQETRDFVDPTNYARWKSTTVFPIRNALTRGKPVSVAAGGEQAYLVPEGAVAAWKWAGLLFDTHELEFILRLLDPTMTFFDVGANVGLFSVLAARRLRNGKVFSFEPCEWTYQRLARNVQLNGLSNVCAVQTALGDFVGEAVLKVNVKGKDGLNTLGKATHSQCEIVAEETVAITTLDEFMLTAKIPNVDLIKADIEGGELSLFRGATNLLKREDAPLILYECGSLSRGFGYHPLESMWYLEKLGYCHFVLDPNTGQVSLPEASRERDVMAIAAKPNHRLYLKLWGLEP
jgi:FkbM family methyltransferase